MYLCDNFKSLIIAMNLCNISYTTQLSNLDLHDVSRLLSHKDLRYSNLQKTIVKVLCLGKCFQNLFKEKSGLNEDDDISEKLVPTTFNKENFMNMVKERAQVMSNVDDERCQVLLSNVI
jgi:hypothetical protein